MISIPQRASSRSALPLLLAASLCGCVYDWGGEWRDAGAADSTPADAACVPGANGKTADCSETDGVPGTWCAIPAGSFTMGSPKEELCRGLEVERCVTLTRSFEISQTEVTQDQFATLMGYNPSFFSATDSSPRSCGEASCGDNPVDQVTWHEAAAYCNALSRRQNLTPCYSCVCGSAVCAQDNCINGSCVKHDGQSNPCAGVACAAGEICVKDGQGSACKPRELDSVTCSVPNYRHGDIYRCPGYRLPTDAEWEYAYRAGTTSSYHNGTEISTVDCTAEDDNLDPIAWYKHNSDLRTHKVGAKKANRFGLHDMAGNAYEHIHERFQYSISDLDAVDPFGFTVGSFYLVRGGSYAASAFGCRSSARHRLDASGSKLDYRVEAGFRCVRSF